MGYFMTISRINVSLILISLIMCLSIVVLACGGKKDPTPVPATSVPEPTATSVPEPTATPKNETVFLRPRPGASRMYPETDIPTIKISDNELENAKLMIPKSWDESISQIQNKYKINEQLSEQIFDSEYFDLFEKICGSKKSSPSFVASVLCSTITNLQRNSFDASLLKDNEILDTFDLLNDNKISKESIEIIFKQIMSGDAVSVSEAIQNASIKSLTEEELNKILDVIIQDHLDEIKRDGMHSIR